AVEGRDALPVLLLRCEGGPERPPDCRVVHSQSCEVATALPPQLLRIPERDYRRIHRYGRHDGIPHYLRVAGHHGTVVTVARVGAFCLFEYRPRIENPVYPRGGEFVYVAVGEFGRETDVVRHDRVDARFVGTVGGGGGEHDFESGLGEERVPEGI